MARYINTRVLSLALVLILGISAAHAQAPVAGSAADNKVGIVSIQDAIANTNEGKKELDALQQKFAPRQAALQTQNDELENLKKQLQAQSDKLSDEERNSRVRSATEKQKSLQRSAEDFQNEVQTAEQEILNRLGKKMSAFVAGAALLAWATPPTAGAVLFYWLFNPDGGLVDWALSRMPTWLVGSTNWAQYNWTTTGALQAYTVATILVVWTSFPFIAVAVLAGLKTVPAELYEAARVDGATRSRVFRRITFPLLKPIFLVLLLLSVIWDFNIFTQTYILTGFPGNQNEYNLSLYIYDKAFGFPPSYGLGGALALIFTLIVLVITVSYVRASVRQGALT